MLRTNEVKEIIEKIKELAEPAGWVTTTEKRREGRSDEIQVQVTFKVKD